MQEKLELIQSLYEYLPKLYGGVEQVVAYYRTKQIAMADELIVNVLDGLAWSIDGLALTQDVQTQTVDLEAIRDLLKEMVGALENSDKVLIADLLEYEIVEQIKTWFDNVEDTLSKNGLLVESEVE